MSGTERSGRRMEAGIERSGIGDVEKEGNGGEVCICEIERERTIEI